MGKRNFHQKKDSQIIQELMTNNACSMSEVIGIIFFLLSIKILFLSF